MVLFGSSRYAHVHAYENRKKLVSPNSHWSIGAQYILSQAKAQLDNTYQKRSRNPWADEADQNAAKEKTNSAKTKIQELTERLEKCTSTVYANLDAEINDINSIHHDLLQIAIKADDLRYLNEHMDKIQSEYKTMLQYQELMVHYQAIANEYLRKAELCAKKADNLERKPLLTIMQEKFIQQVSQYRDEYLYPRVYSVATEGAKFLIFGCICGYLANKYPAFNIFISKIRHS